MEKNNNQFWLKDPATFIIWGECEACGAYKQNKASLWIIEWSPEDNDWLWHLTFNPCRTCKHINTWSPTSSMFLQYITSKEEQLRLILEPLLKIAISKKEEK